MSQTETSTPFPLVSALKATEVFMGPDRDWSTTNEDQRTFLKLYHSTVKDLLKIPELESIAAKDVAHINSFLASKGYDIVLDPLGGDPDDFAVAAAMKIALEWLSVGVPGTLTSARKTYESVYLDECVRFYKNAQGPLACISTRSGDKVYLQVCKKPKKLFKYGLEMTDGLKALYDYDGLVFPKVTLDVREDVGWLVGMSAPNTVGRVGSITQAVQQTKFKMDEKGAVVESAAAMAVCFESCRVSRPAMTITEPFVIAIVRDGLNMPLFTAYVDRDCWRPSTL